MQTRYILHIPDEDYELKDDDLRNWDEVRCSYKRSGFDGVVRSFSSQFEFVNHAGELLTALYLADRYNAEASITILTKNENWTYDERFSCPLDFSSIVIDGETVKISCVDNGMSALIKSNRNTKFEFAIGEDIESDVQFLFNRVRVRESVTYEITGGESNEDDGSLYVPASENNRIYCGLVNDDEINVGGVLHYNDDQTTDANSCILTAYKEVELNIDLSVTFDQCYQVGSGMLGRMIVIHTDNSIQPVISDFNFGSHGKTFKGNYDNESQLRIAWPKSSVQDGDWATVAGIVWAVNYKIDQEHTDWENMNVTADVYRRMKITRNATVTLAVGEKLAFATTGPGAHVYASEFKFSWIAKGSPCMIDGFSPVTVAERLLLKICEGKINPRVVISPYDERIYDTVILAAESIRGLTEAKLYTSFSEFCDWMSVVFGYVYYIGEETDSVFHHYRESLGGYTSTPYPLSEDNWIEHHSTAPAVEQIMYFENYGRFVAYDGTAWYDKFPGGENYNDSQTNEARTDTIFRIRKTENGVAIAKLYYFERDIEGNLNNKPVEYRGNLDDMNKKYQEFCFVHRSEIFRPDADIRFIPDCKSVKLSADTSYIYSAVTAGYEKKDYESINGRDEFNFNNTYTTGCTVSDKEFQLISKYRADSYGIEFAAQKRGADSTDSKSDKDVFFVKVKNGQDGLKVVDDSNVISGAMSEDVFNGAFSPMACIMANAGYICLQSSQMKLGFASSTGNSSVEIDGVGMSSDLDIDTSLATSDVLEFTTDETDDIADVNSIIKIRSGGLTYKGYLKEVDIKFARAESVKYKLIVKEVEP